MSERLRMAAALVGWARKRFDELAPYSYDSFVLQEATLEFKIAIKEILDPLRSALDFLAAETYSRLPHASPAQRVYFPIARPSASTKEFENLVQSKIPGLQAAWPQMFDLLASLQFFKSPVHRWLPDLATLSNENKHQRLSIQRDVSAPVEQLPELAGCPFYCFHRNDNAPLAPGFRICFVSSRPLDVGGGRSVYEGWYFRFDAIDHEVESFLLAAIDGTIRITREVATCCGHSLDIPSFMAPQKKLRDRAKSDELKFIVIGSEVSHVVRREQH